MSAIAAVAAVLSAAAPGDAVAARCPPADVLPRVSLTTEPGRILYSTRLGRRDLQRLQGKSGALSRKRGWHPIGLTLTELQFRMSISVNTLSRGDRRYCATVGRVEGSLGYDTITVHVDRRYPRGSCQYHSVIAHEEKHVAIFRDTLALYAPRVERHLMEAAATVRPVSANSPKRAAAMIKKALQREMEPLFQEMNKVLDTENDRIDTSANYQREQAKCSTW